MELRRDIEAEMADVTRELERPYLLRFRPALEAAYREDQRQRAVVAFRRNALFILLLYVLLSTGIYMLMPAGDIERWFSLYGWVGAIIITAFLLAHVRALDRWYAGYIGVGGFIAVALSVAVTGVVHDPTAGSLTHAGIMYAMVIIYDLCGLRLTHGLIAGWAGGLAGMLLAQGLGGSVDWAVLHRTYTGSSLLGMFLAYFTEQRDRAMYLQTRLLALGQERAEGYAQQLDHLAREDPLTGLANRRHFQEMFEHEWRRALRSGKPMSLLLIDIDHFKCYNDSFGHSRGDECLRAVALILQEHARRSGDLAVRYGGEEFLLLVPEATATEARRSAADLVQRVRAAELPHSDLADHNMVTVSIGVSTVVPTVRSSPQVLIEAADRALYRAKGSGRNTWAFADCEVRETA